MKTVRNGQKVWPYCEECGCRLHLSYNVSSLKSKQVMACHYGWKYSEDAVGHKCSLVNKTYFTSLEAVSVYEVIDIGLDPII